MSAVSPLVGLSHHKNLTKYLKEKTCTPAYRKYQYSASDTTKTRLIATFILKHTSFRLEINDIKLTKTVLVCLSKIISFDDLIWSKLILSKM